MRGHALQRAMERCPGVCPGLLIKGVKWAVATDREDLAEYIGQVKDEAFTALYQLSLANGDTRFALVDRASNFVVTFLPESGSIALDRGRYDLDKKAFRGSM